MEPIPLMDSVGLVDIVAALIALSVIVGMAVVGFGKERKAS